MSNPEWDNYDPDPDWRKIEKLQARITKAVAELIDVQPHLEQACYPGHAGFIEAHIDMALEHLTGVPHNKGSPV